MKTGIQETDKLINKTVRLVVETGALNGESHVFDTDTYIMKQCVSECHSSPAITFFAWPVCIMARRV